MKKIAIMAALAALLITGTFAENNSTSLWDKAKQVTTNVAHTVVNKYNDTNLTAIKNAVRNKYLMVKYPEVEKYLEDIWQRGQRINNDESLDKIKESFKEAIKKYLNQPEQFELVLNRIAEFNSLNINKEKQKQTD